MLNVVTALLGVTVGLLSCVLGWLLLHRPKVLALPGTDEVDMENLPYDPQHPPEMKVYSPRPGSVLRRCYCHDVEVKPGSSVMLWYFPDGSAALICEREVRAALKGGAV